MFQLSIICLLWSCWWKGIQKQVKDNGSFEKWLNYIMVKKMSCLVYNTMHGYSYFIMHEFINLWCLHCNYAVSFSAEHWHYYFFKKITLSLIKFKKVRLFSHLIIMLQISFQSNNNYIYTLSYYTFEKLTLSICHKMIVPSHRVVQHRFIWGLDRKNFATQD